MTNANPAALLRSLIVYAICVPLAILVGFTLVDLTNNYRDTQSLVIIAVLMGVLVLPLLMKWHYPMLLFSWNLPVTLFFLPGRPNLFIPMVVASLIISIIERILNRNRPFVPTGGVKWPLLAMLGVVYMTAKLTGGFGLRSMGSDVYGGKKYIFLVMGILSFFALTARPISKKQANVYITLFFAGYLFQIISDLSAYAPSALQGIYLLIPPSELGLATGGGSVDWGKTRMAGISTAAAATLAWTLARHGFRGSLMTHKLWRPALAFGSIALIFLGGFRSAIIEVMMILAILFVLERIYHTTMMLVVVLVGIAGAAAIVPLAPHLPYTFQRALAFLPLDISTEARMDAEGSTEWRLEIWQALLPQIPEYLLLGKGYAFTQEVFNESMGADAMFQRTIDASQNALALSSDFHNGPLSLLIPFGIWGVIAYLWFMAAGLRVVWRNYRYGDPDLQRINNFLFCFFLTKAVIFFFIFGDIVSDTPRFCVIIGLSLAMNNGVRKAVPRPQNRPSVVNSRWALPARPAI